MRDEMPHEIGLLLVPADYVLFTQIVNYTTFVEENELVDGALQLLQTWHEVRKTGRRVVYRNEARGEQFGAAQGIAYSNERALAMRGEGFVAINFKICLSLTAQRIIHVVLANTPRSPFDVEYTVYEALSHYTAAVLRCRNGRWVLGSLARDGNFTPLTIPGLPMLYH